MLLIDLRPFGACHPCFGQWQEMLGATSEERIEANACHQMHQTANHVMAGQNGDAAFDAVYPHDAVAPMRGWHRNEHRVALNHEPVTFVGPIGTRDAQEILDVEHVTQSLPGYVDPTSNSGIGVKIRTGCNTARESCSDVPLLGSSDRLRLQNMRPRCIAAVLWCIPLGMAHAIDQPATDFVPLHAVVASSFRPGPLRHR